MHRQDADPGGYGLGPSIDDVLAAYSTLTREDVLTTLQFAANAVDERQLPQRLTA